MRIRLGDVVQVADSHGGHRGEVIEMVSGDGGPDCVFAIMMLTPETSNRGRGNFMEPVYTRRRFRGRDVVAIVEPA